MPPRRTDRLGKALTALSAGALAFNLLMVIALLGLIGYYGIGAFWQLDLELVTTRDGQRLLGSLEDAETFTPGDGKPVVERLKFRVGNRDFTDSEFVWIDVPDIVSREKPADAVLLEREEWGPFHGWIAEVRKDEEVLASGHQACWELLQTLLPAKAEERAAVEALRGGELADVNREIEGIKRARRLLELRRSDAGGDPTELPAGADRLETQLAAAQARYEDLEARLFALRSALLAERIVIEAPSGKRKELAVGHVFRAIQPNAMSVADKLGLYAARLADFLFDEPRESNTEGGIFPAIFGTVLMVFLMSIAVVPLGVLAALYLHEYARQGAFVRMVRIAVNNLAGTPSIVFGVFGLGFFVYMVGGSIDSLFYPERLPAPTYGTGGILWASLTLALLTVPVVIVATEEGLSAVPRIMREGSYALGATKWETMRRVVIPSAMPGILTGMILAMARAAGEVAPLMIVGMVKMAPQLPVDGHYPFMHLERKFMHMGFHIYDLAFQSPNVEAVKPLVFATAFLLILIVVLMNLFAIRLRNRIRARHMGSVV